MSYQASHGILLFRSPKHRLNAATNIDVLFTDVRAIELRAWTEGLVIEEVEAGVVADATSRPADLIEPGNRVYAVRGSGWEGFIVGGTFHTVEDDTDEMEPTKLMEATVR